MRLVHDANEAHIASGKQDGIPFDEFYNDAVNEHFDYRNDYRNWRSASACYRRSVVDSVFFFQGRNKDFRLQTFRSFSTLEANQIFSK